MKKSILFFATAVICAVAFSSCEQQEQQEIEKAVTKELNYCEVTVLANRGNYVHDNGYYYYDGAHYYGDSFSITYENGYGENLGTYLVPQNTLLTISWEYSNGTYTETFNVGTASKLTIVISGDEAEANY